jgi:uncharacterized membrane protein
MPTVRLQKITLVDLKTIINSVGILLTIVGVYIVYKNSPINFHTIDGGTASTDFEANRRKTERKNLLIRVGVHVILWGSALQLISNFIPRGHGTSAT